MVKVTHVTMIENLNPNGEDLYEIIFTAPSNDLAERDLMW